MFLVEWGCSCWDSGHSTRVGRADKEDLYDERVLRFRQYKAEVAVMDPSTWSLDQHLVLGAEIMGLLDR